MAAPLLAAIPGALKLLNGALDFFDGDKKRQAEVAIKELEAGYAAQMAQLEVNKTEAQHPSLFVAGWRPAVGWCSIIAILYAVLLQPLLSWLSVNAGWVAPPMIDEVIFVELLMAMLGVSGLRTYEKRQGVSTLTVRALDR